MNKNSLAIASIPIQNCNDMLEPDKALKTGTVFPCLDLPFFAAANVHDTTSQTLNEQEQLMKDITDISFVLNDLTLYLDTHPTCEKSLNAYHQYLTKRIDLLAEFAKKYYPLTQSSIITGGCDTSPYSWCKGPAPWEGACN